MQSTSSAVRFLAAGALAAVLLGGAGAGAGQAAAAPAQGAAVAASVQGPAVAHTAAYGRLHPIADLSARRLATADLVAAAKYGTDSPIDDPARERQVLDDVARQAREMGADPEVTVRIFRDQIEANKVVQRALHHRWGADPSKAPTERPDLAEVRKEINRVNGELVRAIAGSAATRTALYCGGLLTAAAVHVRHDRQLDALHTVALERVLRSVCGA
ncbi:gamma subclass chorismate mutase AroQ [Streptomyces sp. NPDC050658]|uniref:gamma subclass chorismate mutase AroQ n=1 Tax=unclassified Streptomyces TaxID=2593676 RepID=UPI00343908DC